MLCPSQKFTTFTYDCIFYPLLRSYDTNNTRHSLTLLRVPVALCACTT